MNDKQSKNKINNTNITSLNKINLSNSQLITKTIITPSQQHQIQNSIINNIQNLSFQLNKQHHQTSNDKISSHNDLSNISELSNMNKSKIIKSRQKQINQYNLHKNQENPFSKSNISVFSQFQCQDTDIMGYFSQFNPKNDPTNKIKMYQKDIFVTIKKQISNGNLLIQKTKPFPLKNRQKSHLQQEEQMKLKLQLKRQQAIEKIKQIQQQELQLKRRAISTYERPRRNGNVDILKLSESIDKGQLKKALQQYKKFTQQMQKRQQQIQQQQQHKHMLQLQKQQQIMKIRRQSRRQQIKTNLKQIMQRQKVRKSIVQQWKAKQKQIKNKKYLYIQYKNKDKKQQQIKQLQKHNILQRIRNNHKFDKQDIQKHRIKYQQLLQQRKQISKSLSNSIVTNISENKKYQYSKFHQIIIKELQDKKKIQLHKIMKVKENQFKQKINKYQEKIDQEIKPNLQYKKFVPFARSMSVDTLAPQEQRQLGLKYLQKAKQLKMSQDKLKLSQMKKQSQDRLKISRSKNSYKDYLRQIKQDLKYDPTQKKLDQILRQKKSNSDYQTLKDAKNLSQILVQKSKNTEQKKTMLAIQKKIDILNILC